MNIVIQVIRWAFSLLWLIMVIGSFQQGGFMGLVFVLIFVTAFSYTCPPIHAEIKKQRAKQEQAELQKIKEDKAVIKDKLNHIRLIYLSQLNLLLHNWMGGKRHRLK